MPPRDPTCAYLGPDGSYTSQAARQLVRLARVALIPCATIADVFAADTTHAVVPLENTIHGVVQETLGCLLASSPAAAAEEEEEEGQPRWSVSTTYDKPIQHALVVKRGTPIENVRWVASHEQALGQCQAFLGATFPSAKILAVSSTALAAHTVHAYAYPDIPPVHAPAPIPDTLRDSPGAAICSVELAQSLSGLEIVRKSIQDVQDNHTRFMLLCRRDATGTDTAAAAATATAAAATTTAAQDPASTCFFRIDDPRTLTAFLGRRSTTLVAVHSKAFPASSRANNGHPPSHPQELHKVQAKYAEKYNKRYLVEVVAPTPLEHADLPGVVRL
ncbi:hypothetical protein NliqN6_2605 [Naganishia liquefaciens]|uniref:Prephenate dehydratase domain-containing protein n=1 Tax=Naganishia liquefaciens TaxID=104408 RepID=A0A8H3TS99_9TREE|nr:hypothetical protein NliqN6_2605 [Naganishia liquefaciens]